MKENILKAHKHSAYHWKEIKNSGVCGCFYCCKTFDSSEIKKWVDDGDSALCPKCGIDSVIGSASGYPITKEFLQKMKAYWFSIRAV